MIRLIVLLMVALCAPMASADWFYTPTEQDRVQLQRLLNNQPNALRFSGPYAREWRDNLAQLKKRGYRTARIMRRNGIQRLLIVPARPLKREIPAEVLIRNNVIVEVTLPIKLSQKAAQKGGFFFSIINDFPDTALEAVSWRTE